MHHRYRAASGDIVDQTITLRNQSCESAQMYYLPQAEGMLLRAFDDRSRERG